MDVVAPTRRDMQEAVPCGTAGAHTLSACLGPCRRLREIRRGLPRLPPPARTVTGILGPAHGLAVRTGLRGPHYFPPNSI